jgi:hypothetical protein
MKLCQLAALPENLKKLERAVEYPVWVSEQVKELARAVDAEQSEKEERDRLHLVEASGWR